ncbi:MFS transporter [Evansella sp. AB-P1]|uniref:MFS transporter n=1 Tax=Evansella sp. AB-P1 TaxID=3037653 RepID=UPI00241D882E|nr:MFS transporter [Evansella sp. AB-P1]MDG5787178.1 MFS transporter [Evansella sp. AB-P1]
MKRNKWIALLWISIAQLFALSLWFSATVIVPELKHVWSLNNNTEAWVTATIPIGFVIGAFVSSYLGIADRYNTRNIFAASAFLGAIFNLMLIFVGSAYLGIFLRILTGLTLAGVYPTAVKLLSQWFPKNRGLAIGILIAALTLGSSLPHFILVFFTDVNWKFVIIISSVLAFLSAAVMKWFVEDPPMKSDKTPFSFLLLRKVIRNKKVMLANYGYFGHMWELYAMWTWLPVFFYGSFTSYSTEISPWFIPLASFISIGIAGGIGCVIGGYIADKIGRSRLTIISMFMSACCAILIGFTYSHAIWITLLVAIIWGIFVISDSAQFSAAVSEFADIEYLGTALTFQMCVGFMITIISINIIPLLESVIGWQLVFSILSIGPILGIISMMKLQHYESVSD